MRLDVRRLDEVSSTNDEAKRKADDDAKRRADALHQAADELPALGTRRSGRGEEEVPHNHGGSHPNTPRDDVQQP